MNAAIEIRRVSKKYVVRGDSGILKSKKGDFWALHDLDFTIRRGEAFGIIGNNGSGKSTLLKLMTGITAPDSGSITVHGNLSALLELGAGFHPELTGIENLYVAGALYGKTREDLTPLLDSIIEFSGIRDAAFDPVKTYSSGMYVRLAFSLAIHLQPENLVLDEVFAVGDELFQRKCYEKMKLFHDRGATMVFVSHDLKIMSSFCNRILLLDRGRAVTIGEPAETIERYHAMSARRLESSGLQLRYSGRMFSLHRGQMELTDKMCIYTSFRIGDVWLDSLRYDWECLEGSEEKLVMSGRMAHSGVDQIWTIDRIPGKGFRLRVELICRVGVSIERAQVNVMLKAAYSRWSAGGREMDFPDRFSENVGEDWDRLAIASANGSIHAMSAEDGLGRVSLSSRMQKGALLVVNTGAQLNARVLQYSRSFFESDRDQQGQWLLFEGEIRAFQTLQTF